MPGHAIEIKDLRYRYPNGTAALNGVSLELGYGESVAIIGGNGAGKSTLLMHLNGLLKADSGRIKVTGLVVDDHLKEIRQKVGFVFQNPDDQLFMPTVREDVNFGPVNMGLSVDEAGRRTQEALKYVGAWELRDKAPYHLSGGEKRAVSIATVLSMEPEILILDEPASGLDPAARRRLINLLIEQETTVVMATHDLDMALDICPRCIVLKHGAVAADGATDQILRNKRLLEDCYLEQPYRMMDC